MANLAKPLQMTLNRHPDGSANITIFDPDDAEPLPADSSHPRWDEILKLALANDPKVLDIINPHKAIGRKSLSERVVYDSGRLYFDHDLVSDGLSKMIIRMVAADEEFPPWVNLMEKIRQNPSVNSRKQLYSYIDRHHVTIHLDGDLVLYKYVYDNHQGNTKKAYCSGNAGPAIVNGKEHKTGFVEQDIGDVVEMPRSQVVDNPSIGCASGLHVGEWSYVATSGNARLEIRVNPRDVVSVPSNSNERKLRVCRYKIIRTVDKPYVVPVLREEKPAEKPPKAAQAAVASKKTTGAHPKPKDFSAAKEIARRQKKGLIAYATKRLGWHKLSDTTGDHRTDWTV